MRNKIQLYIGSERADLDNNSFLLLNYTMEELSNPTIVRNSFSRQITLKGTPQNMKIFGGIYRNDRVTQYTGGYTGIDFDPTRKTPFTIYNEMHEILESGYLKLDKVTTTKKRVEFTVTLYGGLGSFLYGLSYRSTGEKMSLADLDFGRSLDFVIDRDAVANAWKRLGGNTSMDAKWDIINFIPAYNGLPAGEFSADKAVVNAQSCGLTEKDGDYTTKEGWTLVSLPEKVTGNEAKDYRSYLQKPCIKMAAIINAICDPANNGGYTVNLDSEFFASTNPYWAKTWLTLPKMVDLNLDITSTNGTFTVVEAPYTYTIPNGGNLSTNYSVIFNICPDFGFPAGTTGDFVLHCEDDWAAGMQGDESPGYYLNYFEFTLTIYASDDTVLDTVTFRVSTEQPPSYFPQMDFILDHIDAATGNGYKDGQLFSFPVTMSQYGANKVKIEMTSKALAWGHLRGSAMPDTAWPYNDYDAQDGVACTIGYVRDETVFSWQYISSSTARTGASITKAALLGGSRTPADYLLSFCKMFGLQIVCNKESKEVDIILRKNFYNGGTKDISGRIDRGRPIEKTPFAFDARWYLFGNDAKGDYGEFYANKYGRPYGQFRVNTGYDFDAVEKRLTDSIVFGNACSVLETSKYFCDLSVGGISVPSLFIGGGKYSLYKGNENKDFDIPLLPAALKTWDNPSHPMHDDWPKMQFHGNGNSTIDERDTLVFFVGMTSPHSGHVSLTDDTRVMLQLNGNSPCWLPGYGDYYSSWKLMDIPNFSRYIRSNNAVQKSLDFGDPLEAMIPDISFVSRSNIFDQYWADYIGDRYDDDSAVLVCYVDLRGMQVNENLFRRFYAFDGAIWAMNRIINHSLTTSGTTQCEFVKVQSTSNYTIL